MVSTVITHLSNTLNIVPPAPTPHPNWLYFNGEFNTNLMPSGFTNFDDELLTYTGSIGNLQYLIQYRSSNFLLEYMGTPKIIQFLGEHSNSWELTNNELKRVQTGNLPPDGDYYNDYRAYLFLPISIPHTFVKACFEFDWVGDAVNVQTGEEARLRVATTNSGLILINSKPNGQYEWSDDVVAGTYTREFPIGAIEYAYPYVTGEPFYFCLEPYLTTREMILREVWFEEAPTELPNNVIFDQGAFNTNRMKPGFSLNNILTVQSVYPGTVATEGMAKIRNNFTSQIAADDGTTFVNYGTDENLLQKDFGYLEHFGRSNTNNNVDECDYVFPIRVGNLLQEGYTKLHIAVQRSAVGIESATSRSRYMTINVDTIEADNTLSIKCYKQHNFGSNPSFSRLVDVTVDLNANGYDWKPDYLEILMDHGTYVINKIWFD